MNVENEQMNAENEPPQVVRYVIVDITPSFPFLHHFQFHYWFTALTPSPSPTSFPLFYIKVSLPLHPLYLFSSLLLSQASSLFFFLTFPSTSTLKLFFVSLLSFFHLFSHYLIFSSLRFSSLLFTLSLLCLLPLLFLPRSSPSCAFFFCFTLLPHFSSPLFPFSPFFFYSLISFSLSLTRSLALSLSLSYFQSVRWISQSSCKKGSREEEEGWQKGEGRGRRSCCHSW